MAVDLTSIYNNQNSIEYLVQQYMQIEARPRNKLAQQRDLLSSKNTVLTELDSKLSVLKTKVDRLTDPNTDYFATKLATGSNNDQFTISAAASTNLGNHSLTVDRLASSDTRVSQQYTDTSTVLQTAFSSDQTFSIFVANPTTADANNRAQIDVTISAADFAADDGTALDSIRDAINTAMSDAVAAGTIENDEVAHASVISEQNGKSRLVIRANQSGYANRLTFGESTGNLLQSLQVNSASQSTGTAGGYITLVGTDETTSMLNSKFNIDGLNFYRDTNNVTDAINGLTIRLLDTFTTTESITVTPDGEGVKAEIQGFLDAYNDVINSLKKNAQIDPVTYKRGVLADDIVYRGMSNSLRSAIGGEVSAASSALYQHLYKIGIEADSNGNLSFTDSDAFTTALETNSNYVSDIFNATDGIGVVIKNYIDNFVAVGGTIDSSKENIDANIKNLDNRISSMDDLLNVRENQLRSQFSEMQAMMAKLSSQMSFFGRISNLY